MTARRGRPPKPPDEVRTVRVTVLLDDREHATLLRACGGRGVATLLREAGPREAAAMAPGALKAPKGARGRVVRVRAKDARAWLASRGVT